jgi:hypothetical protein
VHVVHGVLAVALRGEIRVDLLEPLGLVLDLGHLVRADPRDEVLVDVGPVALLRLVPNVGCRDVVEPVREPVGDGLRFAAGSAHDPLVALTLKLFHGLYDRVIRSVALPHDVTTVWLAVVLQAHGHAAVPVTILAEIDA